MKTVCLALCGASLVLVPVAASGAPSGKTWQLSKVVLDTETNEVSARVKGGTLCVFSSVAGDRWDLTAQVHLWF